MADRTSRLVTGTFVIYETDGPDAGGTPDARPLVGLVVQFAPDQEISKETYPDRIAFHAPIFGVTDSQGRLTSPDGTLGIRVPTSNPGGILYKVTVIPPDGSQVRPYKFKLFIDYSDLPLVFNEAVPEVTRITEIMAGFGPPGADKVEVAYFDLLDVNGDGVMLYAPAALGGS